MRFKKETKYKKNAYQQQQAKKEYIASWLRNKVCVEWCVVLVVPAGSEDGRNL